MTYGESPSQRGGQRVPRRRRAIGRQEAPLPRTTLVTGIGAALCGPFSLARLLAPAMGRPRDMVFFGGGGGGWRRGPGGSRFKVYGCSPGCLLTSLAISVFLTVVLNLLIRAF